MIYLKPEKVPLSGGASLINVIESAPPPRIGVFRIISDNKLNFILYLIYLHCIQAYHSWVRANGRENPLPDLSMNVDQLFFIGFATVCFGQFDCSPSHNNSV